MGKISNKELNKALSTIDKLYVDLQMKEWSDIVANTAPGNTLMLNDMKQGFCEVVVQVKDMLEDLDVTPINDVDGTYASVLFRVAKEINDQIVEIDKAIKIQIEVKQASANHNEQCFTKVVDKPLNTEE